MQINKCIASKPGLFDNKEIDLNSNITIIYGKNDSGKSLLSRAILDVIGGPISEKTLLDKHLWDNLHLDISLTNSKNRYRFTKNGERDFSIKIVEGDQEIEIFNKEKIESHSKDDIMVALSEIPKNREEKLISFYLNTDLRSIMTLSFLPPPAEMGKGEILNYESFRQLFLDDKSRFYSLKNQIMGIFDQEKISHRLNSVIFNDILKSESEMKELEKRIQITDIQDSKFEKMIKEKKLIENEIYDIKEKLSILRNRKTIMAKILNNIKKRDELMQKIENMKNEIDSANEKKEQTVSLTKEIDNSYPQFRNFNETKRKNLKKIHKYYREIRDINVNIENSASKIKTKKKKFKTFIISIFISSAIAILLAMNNIFIKITQDEQSTLVIWLLAISLLSTLILILIYIFSRNTKELTTLLAEKSGIEENLEKTLLENNVKLSDLKLESLYEFLLQYFEEFGEYTEKQLDLFKMKEQLVDSLQIKKLKKDLQEFERIEDEIKKEINSDSKSIGANNIELEQTKTNNTVLNINNEIKIIKEKIGNKKRILLQLSEEVQQHTANKDEKYLLIEKKNKLKSNLKELNTHKDSMNYILKILTEAIEKREEKQLQKLINSTIENFNFLTNNQYISIIDKDGIKNLIKENEPSKKFNPTITHLLFLSIKIAITNFLIDSDSTFPLIIDDPFTFMDNIRAEKLRTLLNDISKFRQVIIFTHNSAYRDWGGYTEL